MKRSGFKSKTYERAPKPKYQPIAQEVAARFKVVPVAQEVTTLDKPEVNRNPALLRMARGKPCMLMLDFCDGGGDTTVAAHSNQAKHGKAGARKANDEYSVWACFACHSWLDQGKGTREEKDAAFDLAHKSQILAWREIFDSYSSKDKDREAARWALEKLGKL